MTVLVLVPTQAGRLHCAVSKLDSPGRMYRARYIQLCLRFVRADADETLLRDADALNLRAREDVARAECERPPRADQLAVLSVVRRDCQRA